MKIISEKHVGNFLMQQISKKWYRIVYDKTAKRNMTMAGAGTAVTEDMPIPFTFVLARLHLIHHSSTFKTLSTDEIILILNRPQVHGVDGFIDDFFKRSDITKSKYILSFEDVGSEGGLVFEASTICLSLESTLNDTIQPIFYIKRLD